MTKWNKDLQIDSLRKLSALVLVGTGAGVFSFLFHKSIEYVSHLLRTHETFAWSTFFFSLGVALLSYLFTKYIFSDTNGSGIPQVKLALVAYKGKMPKRMPFGKLITSFLTLVSGLSFGKEGPMVTISASWGHLVAHILKFGHQRMKVLVACGASAGLSAAFNTPIAAVVFTLEEILGQLHARYLGPIIVTSVLPQ